ncbi:ankyrin repeat-containing domain protein [Aspergillus pseudoustus]|uniref:Ankyrin repeat-containing domain protein n=1 Tax=Aspergillus pseudoustus TaxID=1810923 RepID=A0ABR4IKY2_9EURO
MSFATLPAELLLQVAAYIDSDSDLNSAIRTCGWLYITLDGYLYNRQDKASATAALFWASEHGISSTARRFINIGANFNATKDEGGLTPLMLNAQKGHENLVALLLSLPGINLNAYHELYRKTALHFAAMGGHYGVVELLVQAKGVDLNHCEGDYGATPLIELISATPSGPRKNDAMKLLVEQYGVDLNTPDNKWDLSPLLWAIQGWEPDIACILLERESVRVDFEDPQGRTAIWWAAKRGYEKCVRMLLERDDIDVNAIERKCQTPLWVAAKKGHVAVVRMLIAAGADPTARDDDSYRNALTVAAANDQDEVVSLLISQTGIDYTLEDVECLRAFSLRAQQRGNLESARSISNKLGRQVGSEDGRRRRERPRERAHSTRGTGLISRFRKVLLEPGGG